MSKHAIPVEIVVEAETLTEAREKIIKILSAAYESNRIFHYVMKNGE